MTEKEMLKMSIEEFGRLQDYMQSSVLIHHPECGLFHFQHKVRLFFRLQGKGLYGAHSRSFSSNKQSPNQLRSLLCDLPIPLFS